MDERVCPHCDQPIANEDSLRCIFCGELLPAEKGFISKMKFSTIPVVFVLLVLMLCLMFFTEMF